MSANQLRNSVQLIGHLGHDPEFKKVSGDRSIAKFSLATNERYKNREGETVTETQWHNCVAWGKTADLVQQLCKKGQEMVVRGKLVHRNYDDKDGNKKYVSEIVIEDFVLV